MIPQQLQLQSQYDPEIAKQRMTQFLQVMSRFETLSWKNIIDVATVGIWDVKERDYIFYLYSQYKERQPKDIPGLELRIRGDVSSSFHIAEKGGIGVGSMVFAPELNYDVWDFYNPDLLIRNFSEGKFGEWTGPPRTGKTSGSCVFIEQWISKKYFCVSNIFKKSETNAYEYANNARGLFEIVATFPRKTKWIFVYDEGGASGYSKAQASTLKSTYLNNVCRIIGKLYGNVLYIDQRSLSVPTTIQEFSTTRFHSVEPGIVHLELMHPTSFNRIVKEFPKTKLPYDTRDIADFEMNVNTDKMFHAMSGETKPYQAMQDFLKSPDSIPPKGRKL
ncbi:MAG: hypothetical protein E6K94_09650 [Thaumarchaeota archaeon]|nr:MAG: hypothetical protein E6K94_09650 [Nitrososphaerota archaeon]